ncbi:Chitin binding Peritrophin-A domain family protein [Acanthocheilonema viteae]
MNLQLLTLLLVLIAFTFCYVICTKVERMQHPGFLDGSYDKVKKQWITKHQEHRPRLVNQLSIKEKEVNILPRLNVDDVGKIWNVGKVRQLLFEPIRKHTKRAYDSVRSHNLPIPEHRNGQIRQYEGERMDILAVRERREKYPLRKKEKVDPMKCAGQRDGFYEAGPCERWYLSCRNGKAKRIFCADGMYWNSDKSRCEPKINIIYCRLKFDCTGKNDGVYVDGCSNVFWFCNSETASLSKCPKDLYFSINKLRCDLKETIPACGGIDQDEMKSINSQEKISRKSRQNSRKQITHKMLKPHQKHDICEKRKDGKYAIGKCYERFLLCIGGRSLIVKCHNGQLYSPEYQQCTDARNLQFCRDFMDPETTTADRYSVSCSSLPDGIYELGDCERNFSICRNGVGSNASCAPGFIYNGQTGHCNYEFSVEKCSKFKKTEEAHEQIAHTGIVDKMTGSYRRQNICRKWENGMYAIAKCYEKYLFCIDGRGLVVVCSRGQLFSPEHQQCMDAGKIPYCADLANPETTTITGYSAQCSSLPDGVYELGNCEQNFLICFNGEGSTGSCDPDFVYNGQTGHCDYKFKVEKCLKYRKNKQRRDKSALLYENTDCRCKGQRDGLYAAGCTEKFYSCSNGISTGHECPGDLVFNVDSGFCDYPKNVVACGGYRPMMSDEVGTDEGGITSNLVSGCSILEDGIYGLSPCGSGYYHCLRGATSFAKCAFDLVFNPSVNQCDFRENVPGCAQYNETSDKIKKPIHSLAIKPIEDDISKCKNLSDGFYVEGCSRIYYGCANGETFYMNCPWNLAFDYRSSICDEPNNVEACKSEEMPSSLFDGTAPLMPSCTALSNGAYQLGSCLADYIICRDGVTNLASCPDPLVFNSDNLRCALRSDVVACGKISQPIKNKLDAQCAARPDGIFSYNCSKNFYICAKGKTYLFTCPDRMLYNSKFRRCGNFAEAQACVQTESPICNSPGVIMKSDDKFCDGRPDANYAAGLCSRIFFSCVHTTKVLMSCPETLVFDASINRCEKPENVAECRNNCVSDGQDVAKQLITSTIIPFCVGRKDNIYPLGSCLRSYLQCYNQKGIVKYCPDDMIFNGTLSACVPKEACNRVITLPHVAPGSVGNDDAENKLTEEDTKYPLPRCYKLADGDYSAGCVSDFITCVDGSEIRKKCPNSMVFSNVLRRCVSYDQCAFLMYRVLASFYPSHRLDTHKEWMKQENVVITPSISSPGLPPREASSSVAENCKSQVQCFDTLNENAINMPVSGEDVNRCEYVRKQCINEASDSGKINQVSTEEAATIESHPEEENRIRFCVPEVSGNRIDSIRCDNMDDGLYALDCSDKVAICSGSWKKIYECPQGQFFIPALAKCDESWKCTEKNSCGSDFVGVVYLGKVELVTPSISPLSIGDFSCANKEDGNYGRQCSPIYIKCVQQIPILMRCQTGRLFDQRSSHCISLDRCSMLSTTLDIGKVRCVENERFGIGECNDYYYTCSNGKFVLYKCPPGHIFDIVHGVCGSKCELCGCQADGFTSTSPCNPGEVVPLGPCENTYLECSTHQTFELRRCMNNKYFDPVLLICRFQYEIMKCFGNSISAPALYRVHDSFKHPLQLNPYLTRNKYDRNRHRLKLPYTKSIRITPYRIPNIFFGTFRTPSRNIFIPQMTGAGQLRNVKDTFRVIPTLLGNVPNMRTMGIIDQFHLPGNLPMYSFGASRALISHGSTVKLDSDGTTNRNGAVDSLEGSGEGDNTSAVTDNSRVKRDILFDTELSEREIELKTGLEKKWEAELDTELEDGYFGSEPSLCPKTHSSNITLGVCHPSYIFCNGKENFAYLVDCNDGELFDNRLKQCIPATDCILRAHRQSDVNEKTPCTLLSDGSYALPGCNKYFLSCVSNKTLLRSCVDGLYYDGNKQQCDYKERVSSCNDHSNLENVIKEAKIAMPNADLEVFSTLPNFTCSINSTVSLGCSPSFVICAGGTAYVFICDGDLVFDQITSSCNRIEDTAECDEQDGEQKIFSVTNEFSSPSPLTGFDDLPHTSVNLTKVSYDASSFDCMIAADGLYASKCSPLFFVCSAGHITGFVCQDELLFNVETGFCDQKEYVASCEETDIVNFSTTSSFITEKSLEPNFITAQLSDHSTLIKRWKCEKGFSGIISRGCSRKFVLCVNGEGHLFFCQQDLVYNINNNRCDHPRNVAACGNKAGISFRKRAYETSHFENDSISNFHVVDLRAVGSSNHTMQMYCNASQSQTAAYEHCRRDYIFCTQSGTLRKSYCTNGYLFDGDVGRCVPAEVCGIVDDAIGESMSLAKEKCDDTIDGISKGIGLCLSEYYVCKKGVPILRRCFKHLETFSATAGTCVARSLNPECLQTSDVLTDRIEKLNDTDDFCIHRPDGLYRHPTDCTRILQCFGKEMFEHLPCSDGLVFNEISGGCDYKSNVPECAAASEKSEEGNDPLLSNGSNCEGNSHGEHLADEKDCSVFYRCVWGKLEKLFCPEHTVFNPALSVCDFPSAVPYCKVTV